MSETLSVPKNNHPTSRLALWAWILSFGCTLGNTFLTFALWADMGFRKWEPGVWRLAVLAVIAVLAFLLYLRRDRCTALSLSVGVGVCEEGPEVHEAKVVCCWGNFL